MKIWKIIGVFGLAVITAGGCVFDNNSDNDGEEPLTIGDVNMGGGVFFIEGQGGTVQIGTFDKNLAPVDAKVFVDGIELVQDGAIHSNTVGFPFDEVAADGMVRIVVYALGDSSVNVISVPDFPVIVKPESGATPAVGADLDVEIGYPGGHQYIAYTILEQDNFATGVETTQTLLQQTIPGSMLMNAGAANVNAYSIATGSDIPDEFNFNNQYEIFLTGAVTQRHIEFVAGE